MYSFMTPNGSETLAQTASLALFYWYAGKRPRIQLPKNPSEGVAVIHRPIPGPYHNMFLPLVAGIIECTYSNLCEMAGGGMGDTREFPRIPDEMLQKEWYESGLPEKMADYRNVAKSLNDCDPKTVAYESLCRNLLEWLEERREIIHCEFPE